MKRCLLLMAMVALTIGSGWAQTEGGQNERNGQEVAGIRNPPYGQRFNQTASLVISSADRNPVQVLSNGNMFNEMPATNVEIKLLRPGARTVEIRMGVGYNGRSFTETIVLEANTTSYYMVEPANYGQFRLRKISTVPGTNIDNGGFGNGDYDSYRDRPGGGRYDNRIERLINVESLIRTLRKQSFDDNKIKTAKTTIRKGFLYAEDVKKLMSIFSFDDKKLDLAKFCYRYCIDQQNYFVVTEGFTFSSNADELNDFIDQQQ
jgi:Domain of unknown function (DUF4476)